MAYENFGLCLFFIVSLQFFIKTLCLEVEITYVEDAGGKGAVCLDGSPPAYHLSRGSGDGVDNWLVTLEGGGWCHNVSSCMQRKATRLGSSKKMLPNLPFSAILSDNKGYNPDFYNWNRVKIRYCDGSSYIGDVEAVDPVTKLHFRGARVFRAVIDRLLAEGMKNAKKAMLSGCSAGGLGAVFHCDNFRSLFPATATVKCLSDGGFFINSKDVSGGRYIVDYFNDIVTTHGSAKNLPASCTSKMKPELCFFPENVVGLIKTPVFLLNPAYDSWQIRHVVAPSVADPTGTWNDCKLNLNKCSPVQLETVQDYRAQFLKALSGIGKSSSRGLFIDSCFVHCQSEMQVMWLRADSPMLDKTPIAKAVGDWFFDRSPFQKIDCPYPCNPTCPKRLV